VRCPSPSGSCSARRVALYWLPALPPRRFYDLGVFLVRPCRGTYVPRSTLLEFGPLQSSRASPPPARPFSDQAPSKRSLPFQSLAGPPLVGFLPPGTPLRRVPLFPPHTPSRRHVGDEGRQTLAGAVLRVLAPLDGSGWPRCVRDLSTPPFTVTSRRFAAFFHAARVPGASLQSFPFPGSRTRSRGPFLPWGSSSDCRRRRASRSFTTAFACSRRLFCPSYEPTLRRTPDA